MSENRASEMPPKPSIGVLTYFQSLGPGLSYHKTTLDWQREMLRQGYDATLYVRQDCKDLTPEMAAELHIAATLPMVRKKEYKPDEERTQWHEESVRILQTCFEGLLQKHHILICHDYTLLKSYVILNEALRRATDVVFGTDSKHNNPPVILHVYHSNLASSERPRDTNDPEKYPERWRWISAPWSRPISLSHSSAQEIANGLLIPHSAVGVLPNPFVSPSRELIEAFGTRWLEADVLQVMPFCATRYEHKGIRPVMKVFGHLVLNGVKAFLMLVTANGKGGKGRENVGKMREYAKTCGLEYGRDYIITSDEYKPWASGTPRKFVDELQSYADLFIFASVCEMCPNVLGEAARYGQLVVVPENLAVGAELTEPSTLKFNFPIKGVETYPFGENAFYACVAREVLAVLKTERALRQRSWTRRNYSLPGLFKNALEPLFYKPVPRQFIDMAKLRFRVITEPASAPPEPVPAQSCVAIRHSVEATGEA